MNFNPHTISTRRAGRSRRLVALLTCLGVLGVAAPAFGAFCTGKQNGLWCDGNKLVNCKNGSVTSSTNCANGCQSMPAGTPDKCKAATGFCAGKQNGLWCDGNKLVNCSNGNITSSQNCASGCQSMPAGTPDKCKAPAGFCGGKQNGAWCDGSKLVQCKNGNVDSSQNCANGCQSMPAGTPDKCKEATNFCTGKQNGAWCDGSKLVQCKDNKIASSANCANGCQSMPVGTPDKCKSAATFCTGKQNGAWCNGDSLVYCQNDQQASSQKCANGCQSNPPGVPDQCKAAGSGFCQGKQNGLWCDAKELVNCKDGQVTSSTTCSAGCITMPSGVPDQCATPGGDGKLVLCEPFKPKKAVTCAFGCYSGHKGSDYAAGEGTPVYAPVSGKVVGLVNSYNGQTCKPDFGNYVKIATGPWEVFMAHMNKDIKVQKGGEAKAGQQIGMVSNTGYTLTMKNGIWVCQQGGGHHLHLEVRKNGVAVDAFNHPDVVWSSDCGGNVTPPTGPCVGKQDGLWCDGSKLITCKGGNKTSEQSCPDGCESMPAGVADKCKTPPVAGPCAGKADGKWCEGVKLLSCKGGQISSANTCEYGCQANAQGVDDACKSPPPTGACAEKEDGKFCDGKQLLTCKDAQVLASQSCEHGCGGGGCLAPPDSCAGQGDGAKCQGDTLLICQGGKTGSSKTCAAGCGDSGAGPACFEPPPPNFCTSAADGDWCVGNSLLSCAAGKIAKQTLCPWGCDGQADGANGSCAPDPGAPDACVAKADGGYCFAKEHVVCTGGKATLSEACANGCKVVEGIALCADPEGGDFCADKVSGMWCDGVKLVDCKQGKTQNVTLCPYGCVVADAQPDQCKPPDDAVCAKQGDGAWCADAMLIYCAGGKVGSTAFCAKGCQSTGPGQPGACVDGVGFCGDKINGWWCSGKVLVQCLGGKEVASQSCASGCTSQPPPLSDQCSEPSVFCADKSDGPWCDEGFLVECQGSSETARILCGFGCDTTGGGGACIEIGSSACTAKQSGSTCKGNVLITCDGANVQSSIVCLNGCGSTPDGSANCIVPGALPAGVLEVRTGGACATLKGDLELPVAAQNQRLHPGQLGACNGLTIASDGALISALSMVYGWLNLPREVMGVSGNTPPLENAWRNNHDGYQPCAGGEGQCCARWDRNPGTLGFLYLPLQEAGCMTVDQATALTKALNGLQPVIAAVHWGDGPGYRHWVTLVGAGNGELLMHDPWGGRAAVALKAGALGSYIIDALFVPYLGDGNAVQPGAAPVLNGDGESIPSATIPGGLVFEEGETATPAVGSSVPGSAASSCSAEGSRRSPAALFLLLLGAALVLRRRREAG